MVSQRCCVVSDIIWTYFCHFLRCSRAKFIIKIVNVWTLVAQLFAWPRHVLCRTTLLYKVVWLNCCPCGRTLTLPQESRWTHSVRAYSRHYSQRQCRHIKFLQDGLTFHQQELKCPQNIFTKIILIYFLSIFFEFLYYSESFCKIACKKFEIKWYHSHCDNQNGPKYFKFLNDFSASETYNFRNCYNFGHSGFSRMKLFGK